MYQCRPPESFDPAQHLIYHTEGAVIGAQRVRIPVPLPARKLCVMLMAPDQDFGEYVGGEEGRDAVKALTVAMVRTWQDAADKGLAEQMVQLALDARAALYGERNTLYKRLALSVLSAGDHTRGGGERLVPSTITPLKALVMFLHQVRFC